MNKGHVHAELMAQYAEDAKETDRPWERWEVCMDGRGGSTSWNTCPFSPTWSTGKSYRRKPRRVRVAGEVFDDVVRSHEDMAPEPFFVLDLGVYTVVRRKWEELRPLQYECGLVHTTYEGAMRHLEALKPRVV